MTTILVTGGTGGLGRPTVERLRELGHDVRVLSRTPEAGRVAGDLMTGAGLAAAVAGVDTVLHLATSRGTKDSTQTATLLEACRAARVRHLVYISIVGIESIPYPYYRDKLECEHLIEGSGIPYTILRATQFHDFLGAVLKPLRRWPFYLSLDVPDQPIAVEEVAARLADLAAVEPGGRVPDIGGPEAKPLGELVADWQRAHGTRKPVWTLRIPGRTIRAFRAGHHMTPLPGYGRETFAEYAAREAAAWHERGTNRA